MRSLINISIKRLLNLINSDSSLYSIRNEPEYQQILKEMEAKYEAEHERVSKWLEEQGKL
jgi:hypothetical protein